MNGKPFSEEQIIDVLRESEAGAATKDLCRRHGIGEQTFYRWKAKFGGTDVSEAKKLRALGDENRRLRHIVAELRRDNAVLRGQARRRTVTPVQLVGGQNAGRVRSGAPRNGRVIATFLRIPLCDGCYVFNPEDHTPSGVISEIDSLLLTFPLQALTRNHVPLVRELRKLGRSGTLKSLRDLTQMDEEEWRKLIEKKVAGKPVGFPPDTPGKHDADRINNYARALTRHFRSYAEVLTRKLLAARIVFRKAPKPTRAATTPPAAPTGASSPSATSKVSGRLVRMGTKTPVRELIVWIGRAMTNASGQITVILDQSLKGNTGKNGHFSIKNVPPGTYGLLAGFSGLKTAGSKGSVAFVIKENTKVCDLGEIVVKQG